MVVNLSPFGGAKISQNGDFCFKKYEKMLKPKNRYSLKFLQNKSILFSV